MAQQLTQTRADALIARYIEPYPGDPGKVNYRLNPEYGGYQVWSIMDDFLAGRQTPEEIIRGYDITREAFDAVLIFYVRHRAVIDARVLLNQMDT